MATLKLEIITPDAKVYDGEAEFVELPGVDGDMGVFPQHEALVTALRAGELKITNKGKVEVLAIGEGFAEITATSIGILTDGAVHEKIDEKAAEEAVKRAEELLKSASLQGDELEATQASLARSLAQLKVKRRHASH